MPSSKPSESSPISRRALAPGINMHGPINDFSDRSVSHRDFRSSSVWADRYRKSLRFSLRGWKAYALDTRLVSTRSGFSLTELMVVVVIIGMLATAVTMNVIGKSDTARRTLAKSDIVQYVNAVSEFYAENGRYPTNDEGLAVLAAPTKSSKQGYIKRVNKDPWKRPYQYFVPGTKKESPFEIICYGADGKEGGTDINADISSESIDNE